ncbi:hypothetical protein M409DRAFT_19024 [Zasmidium cellare ATCC 36951]|uniref:N-acetyltransferase domain-containing protein n=1 Tax=Zasmidium cellare ATCC 36951 TaxID=1080233 RepID=A0A6A6CVB2_ZASCE|nr:uncharacterized protein M409DRAFT_19024 [Zasmidium cellare ATCC 36951]KAF2171051.1 hypothetical protein M409DRAFT_19024 [Zasmidium cellare ATCC 36951]
MATPDPKPQLYCHVIDSSNYQDDPSAIEKLFNLSQDIFDTVPGEVPQEQLDEEAKLPPETAPSSQLAAWHWGMAQPHAIIAYASTSPTPNPSTALAVFHGLPCLQPEIGYELFHLRVAAVKAESRGLGIFPMLMGRVQNHARECGWKEMTVITYPHRFVKMARILRSHGWKEMGIRERGPAFLFKISLE